jgi:hypothetical protein
MGGNAFVEGQMGAVARRVGLAVVGAEAVSRVSLDTPVNARPVEASLCEV